VLFHRRDFHKESLDEGVGRLRLVVKIAEPPVEERLQRQPEQLAHLENPEILPRLLKRLRRNELRRRSGHPAGT
jgi:hypothetical protein